MRPSGEEKQNSSSNNSNGVRGSALLVNEPFEEAFGSKSQRKRVKMEQFMTARVSKMDSTDNDDSDPKDGSNNNHKSNNDLMQQLPSIGGKAEIIWTMMIRLGSSSECESESREGIQQQLIDITATIT